jgi:hypothetical protein
MNVATASSHESTKLTNSTYDVISALAKDASFLYSTVDTYLKDAKQDNRTDLVDLWNTIRQDKQRHVQLLREALSKDAGDQHPK